MEERGEGILVDKCKKCEGKGWYRVDYSLAEEEIHAVCEDCYGKGYIDGKEEVKV